MRVTDAVIPPNQRHDLAAIECLVSRRDFASEILRNHPVGVALEEERRGHVENLRNVIEPRCRNPDISGLVFLHGLKRDANLAGQGTLAQAELNASQTHPATDIDVDRMRLVVFAWND